MRILYTEDDMTTVLGIKKKDVKFLTTLGVIPSLDQQPARYLKSEVDTWLASGQWDKHKPHYLDSGPRKGLYIK